MNDLVAGCRRGDSDSLRELMRIQGSGVLALLRKIVGDPQVSESLAQETFFKAFRCMTRFKDGTSLKVWLHAIARNTALDHLRREKAARIDPVALAMVPEPIDPGEGPLEASARREQSERATDALWALSPPDREVVHMRFYQGMTWDSISETLGIAEATTRSRLSYALQRLRGALR
jgi:RNA polymerase sigma-70 factor (ECF subfamily)